MAQAPRSDRRRLGPGAMVAPRPLPRRDAGMALAPRARTFPGNPQSRILPHSLRGATPRHRGAGAGCPRPPSGAKREMIESSGLWMLAAAAVLMLATGLPAWVVLTGVALAFSALGVALGAFEPGLLAALYSRLIGLLENDLLQALPLYVLMGSLINRLPLADVLFRAGARALRWSGCGRALAGLGLGVILAPMSGSVGASASMLTRTVYPRLPPGRHAPARNLALVCMASTLGVVIP